MNFENLQILLVEDDKIDADCLKMDLLKILGISFQLTLVGTLSGALELLKNNKYDVIFCDLNLSDSKGYNTLSKLYMANLYIPIIVLTGLDDEKVFLKSIELGAQDYLIKGTIPPNVLIKTIKASIIRKKTDLALITKKMEFLSNIEHEIRTPMNAIIGMADLLSEGELSLAQKEYLEILKNAGFNLLHIIDSILEITGIETKKLTIKNDEFDIRIALEDIASSLNLKAKKKKLTLTTFISPDVPSHLLGDAYRIKQVLINLIDNSIKFTKEGSITLYISQNNRQEKKGNILFELTDTGIGIEKEDIKKLFMPYSQADSSTTKSYGGAGLGLAIAKKLVELMGGEIWLESEKNIGTKVYFTLDSKKN